jgi:circadian clock protein KaiB
LIVSSDEASTQQTGIVLRLYVAGNSPTSRQAEQNLKHLQALMKAEGAQVEVINVLTHPELAEKAGILATPTLCYEHLGRRRRIIGDLGDPSRIFGFLGIAMKGDVA